MCLKLSVRCLELEEQGQITVLIRFKAVGFGRRPSRSSRKSPGGNKRDAELKKGVQILDRQNRKTANYMQTGLK